MANEVPGTVAGGPVVVATGVGKVFGTGEGKVTALDGIDLSISQGEFVSLIGPSGCGKSTLLRLIGDLTSPTSGNLTVNGKTPSRARLDRDYGMVFQAPVLMDWRTIAKNIELPLEIMGYAADERRRRSADLLRLVELDAFAERHPWELSGGMQQRVAIARALAYEPEVLLMDEPFAAVDAQTRADLEDLVRALWQRLGMTILFVTHDIDEAVYLGQRVLTLSASPTVVQDELTVDLPAERDQLHTRADPRFVTLRTRVYSQIQAAKTGTASGAAGELSNADR
ncbi:MAG: ABC transporter ATP-binding protein [Chloroflexota bacterium]